MLCPICRQVEIVLDCGEAATCVNNHVHCDTCLGCASEKCLICAEPLYQYNAWLRNLATDTRSGLPEMIHEWSHKNAFKLSVSEDSLDDDNHPLGATSMNLLYSSTDAFDADSLQPTYSAHFSDTKWNQSMLCKNVSQEQLLGVDSKCNRSVQIPTTRDSIHLPEKKDTRQNLMEQTKQELRQKIMEEMYKSCRTDQGVKMPPKEFGHIKQLRTVGVSTESTPRLFPDESLKKTLLQSSPVAMPPEDAIKTQILYNTPPDEYLLMNVATSSVGNPHLQEGIQKKSETSCIDLRLHQIMGTLLESVNTPSKEDQHFYKFLREKIFHMPLNKLDETIPSVCSGGDDGKKIEVLTPVQKHAILEKPVGTTLIANCRRAYYSPPAETMPNVAPSPQFQVISLCNINISKELVQTEIIDGTINISRRPVICPMSTCQRAFFVSDFAKHIAVDHSKVPMEGIFPQQCKNFFFDPKLIHFGTNRCQMLLLVKNKIINFGNEKFKDFIPILVMTAKLSLLDICANKHRPQSEEVQRSTQYFVMIWLTGILPPQLPLFFSLTVWARSGFMPACHLVHSGRLYSVRESQSPEAVRRNGQMLLLSNNQIDLLTNGGRHMLELQITVH